jgi:amino acid transporter, AAT family
LSGRSLTAAQREQLEFRMPLLPYASWIALAFLVLVIGLMA